MKQTCDDQQTIEITPDDVPLAMHLLMVSSTAEFAKILGITERSLRDGPMAIWRQMSIECLLRRDGKWEEFCKRRGTPIPPVVTGYHCVICSQCVDKLQRMPLTKPEKG